MQETTISFQGLNLTPYGDMSPDGQLDSCTGLEMHDGSLRPSVLDGTKYILPEEFSDITLKIMHSTQEYSHFIFLNVDGKTLYWAKVNEGLLTVKELYSLGDSVSDLKTVGNTLVIFAESGMHYCLFKDEKYKYIGQKPPETVIQFTLVSELYEAQREAQNMVGHDKIVSDFYSDTLYTETGYMELREDHKEDLTLYENALVSSLTNEAFKAGRIIYPVLMRYAYRMYDGSSYIMQSSPVLLVPNTDISPVVIYRASSKIIASEAYAVANASLVSYEIISADLEDWKDVISSVDIFMTDQIYSRNVDARITHVIRFSESEAGKSTNYGIFPNYGAVKGTGPKTLYESWTDDGKSESESSGYMYAFHGEKMKNHDFLKSISGASVFYKAKSIPVEEIQTNVDAYLFDENNPEAVTLESLTFQETLPDDWQSHDLLIPDNSFLYNNRLNVAGYRRHLFGGYNTSAMMPLVQTEDSTTKYYTIYTHIRKGSKDIVVRNTCSGIQGFYPMYLFYPDTAAYRMTIIEGENPDPSAFYNGWEIKLQPHPLLNGAYWFNSFNPIGESPSRRVYPPELTSSEVRYSNSIATSAVENPFVFPLSGRNTIGTGKIIGLDSIVTPLSTGQFGAFDLMIFTEDGNYAAKITEEGTFSTIKPMQRDVCVNPKTITPTDYMLVYVSGKGVMAADGNSITCISEALDGVPDGYFGNEDTNPRNFFPSCLIAYDYSGNRIIFGSTSGEYAYVRSKDGLWSASKWGAFTSVLNIYPYSYIQQKGSIIRLDKTYPYDPNKVYEGFICTRPLKLGSLQQKKVYRLSIEGSVVDSRNIIVWGSNDGDQWFVIGSSGRREIIRLSGRSFKYWRISMSVKLLGSQNISGFRLLIKESMSRRFR